MIKFEYKFPPLLKEEIASSNYINNILKNSGLLFSEVEKYDKNLSLKYSRFLEMDNILNYIFCNPKDLRKTIRKFYSYYPELAIFFNPRWILTSSKFNIDYTEIIRNRLNSKEEIKRIKLAFINELKKIPSISDFNFTETLIDKLNKSKSTKEELDQLIRITRIHQGISKLPSEITKKFPLWPEILKKVFDYESFKKNYSRMIVDSSGLLICPYCNKRDIEKTAGNKKFANPDLDHFYPQGKYPFLATSLYNLVPSCTFCNQRFKGDTDTFKKYMHPISHGTNNYKAFNFLPTLDENHIIKIGGCSRFKNNIELFELQSEYAKPSSLREYKDVKNKLDFLKELGGEELKKTINSKKKKAIIFNIGGDYNLFNTRHYKLRIDAFNDFLDKE